MGSAGAAESCRTAKVLSLVAVFVLLTLTSGCFFFPRRTGLRPATSAPASLAGVVRYSDGRPAVGVSVALFKSASVAVTDQNGRFSFPSIPSGWQTVLVNKEGYVTAGATVWLNPRQAGSVQLQLLGSDGRLHGASSRVPSLCGSCHQLHQNSPSQLKGGTANSSCYLCHNPAGTANPAFPRFMNQEVYEQTPHYTHANAAINGHGRGDCVNCHLPHGVTNDHTNPAHLLVNPAANSSNPVCYNCHTAAGADGSSIWGWPGQVAYQAADNPHNNPNSADPALLEIYPGSEGHEGECYNCHNPHGMTKDGQVTGQLTTALTRAEGPELCVECHTAFQDVGGATTKHKCTLCHNPHQLKQGGVLLVQRPGVTNRRDLVTVTTFKASHRGQTVLKNDFCTGCHKAGGMAPNPFNNGPAPPRTGFWNIATVPAPPGEQYRNLHAVHVNGPIGYLNQSGTTWVTNNLQGGPNFQGGPTFWGTEGPKYQRYRVCYPTGYGHEYTAKPVAENKVWCIDCHDVHPHANTAGNAKGYKMLRSELITALNWTSASGGGYDGKGYKTDAGVPDGKGCGMVGSTQCHRGNPSNNALAYGSYVLNGCDWCHQANGGNPGQSCECPQTCPAQSYNYGSGGGGSAGFPSKHGNTHHDSVGATNRRTVEL